MTLGESPVANELCKSVKSFESKTGTRVVAASIGGSVSIGLSNKSSDYDLYVFMKRKLQDGIQKACA